MPHTLAIIIIGQQHAALCSVERILPRTHCAGTRLVDGQPCTMREVNIETLITRRHDVDFLNQCFLELRELKSRNTMTATTTSDGTERRGEHKNFDDPFQISRDQLKGC